MAYRLTPKTIGLKLEGSPEDAGRVRFRDLIDALERLHSCLRKVEGIITGSSKAAVYYRVVDMEAKSAEVVLEAVPWQPHNDPSEKILERVESGVNSIIEGQALPHGFDREILESFRALASPLKKRVRNMEIIRPARRLIITPQFEQNIERILGEDVTSGGSMAGFLDAINVHGVRHFYIYPLLGPTRILCQFPDNLLAEISRGLKCHVNVVGMLHYKKSDPFPHQIDVETVEAYPPVEDLPTLGSLRGMAPRATGSTDSVTFIRHLRDASET